MKSAKFHEYELLGDHQVFLSKDQTGLNCFCLFVNMVNSAHTSQLRYIFPILFPALAQVKCRNELKVPLTICLYPLLFKKQTVVLFQVLLI